MKFRPKRKTLLTIGTSFVEYLFIYLFIYLKKTRLLNFKFNFFLNFNNLRNMCAKYLPCLVYL
jgi:hypothetical protein